MRAIFFLIVVVTLSGCENKIDLHSLVQPISSGSYFLEVGKDNFSGLDSLSHFDYPEFKQFPDLLSKNGPGYSGLRFTFYPVVSFKNRLLLYKRIDYLDGDLIYAFLITYNDGKSRLDTLYGLETDPICEYNAEFFIYSDSLVNWSKSNCYNHDSNRFEKDSERRVIYFN